MATRCEYLTARCPDGCEAWLHPKALRPHHGRCAGAPWTDGRRPVTEVLLDNTDADKALRLLPPELLDVPTFGGDRLRAPRPGMFLTYDVRHGLVVRSPIAGVTGRRWWTVAQAALHAGRSIDTTLDPTDFSCLEDELDLVGQLVRCDVCGDDVKPRGLSIHQRSNSVCRFLGAVEEVNTYWGLGYRDPFVLRDRGVPLTWTELNSRVCWRSRLHVVRFRLWTAVMIDER